MKIVSFRLIGATLCVSLMGCGSLVRSEYEQPELAMPDNWSQKSVAGTQQHGAVDVEQPDNWWTLFDDPTLNRLIEQVLASNSDLTLATLTLRKARLEAGLSESDKFPQASFSLNSSIEQDLDGGDSDVDHSASFSLSYELDLWGRVSASADAGEWAAIASFEDRESTAQSLVVTAASLYWKVGYLRQMLSLTEENMTGTERVADLTRHKYNNGAATRLEVLESTQTLFNQQVEYSQLQQELAETENAISILVDQPLRDMDLNIEALSKQAMPAIASGVPSDLLLRRPDIKSSLYRLKSALATKDAVSASYLPTLSLTGSLSSSSSQLAELLQNPVATLGSGLVLPFLQWNEMQLNKDISELDYQIAVVDYRDTLYEAFEEVANLLTARQHYHYQGDILKEQYTNAREIERIYASKYQYGASDMIDWINAMESRRGKESSLLENRYNQFVTQAKLYQSLGGGDIAPKI